MKATKSFIFLCAVICRLNGLQIIQPPISQNVSEGKNVTFACLFNLTLEDQLRFLWRRDRDGIDAETIIAVTSNEDDREVNAKFQNRFSFRQLESTYMLYISPVRLEDTGEYYCQIDNKTENITRTVVLTSTRAQLNVYEPPEDPLCYIQDETNSTKHVCIPNNKGDSLYWDTQHDFLSCPTSNAAEYVQILQCNVNSSFGVQSSVCVIDNRCKVEHEHGGLLVIGDNAKFSCDCHCESSWNITSWTYSNGSEVMSSRSTVQGKRLQIEGVQESDDGLLIRCNANNGTFNTSSGLLKLQTRYPTLQIIQHPISQNVSEGENVTFTCQLNSPLEDQFRLLWRRNDEENDVLTVTSISDNIVKKNFRGRFSSKKDELKYKLYISHVLPEDTGKYYCQIDDGGPNKATNVTKSIILSSTKAQLNVRKFHTSNLFEKYVLYIISVSIVLLFFGLIIIICCVFNKRRKSHKRGRSTLKLKNEPKNDTINIGEVYQCTTTEINTKGQPYTNVSTVGPTNVLYSEIPDYDAVLSKDGANFTNSKHHKDSDDSYDNISYLSAENPIYKLP